MVAYTSSLRPHTLVPSALDGVTSNHIFREKCEKRWQKTNCAEWWNRTDDVTSWRSWRSRAGKSNPRAALRVQDIINATNLSSSIIKGQLSMSFRKLRILETQNYYFFKSLRTKTAILQTENYLVSLTHLCSGSEWHERDTSVCHPWDKKLSLTHIPYLYARAARPLWKTSPGDIGVVTEGRGK